MSLNLFDGVQHCTNIDIFNCEAKCFILVITSSIIVGFAIIDIIIYLSKEK